MTTTHIQYINRFVDRLTIDEKKEILIILLNSQMGDRVKDKGDGVQVFYKDIPVETISIIYNYIKQKIKEKMEKLENIT